MQPRFAPLPLLLLLLLLLAACVPRARHKRLEASFETTLIYMAQQDSELEAAKARIEALEVRCGVQRPSGPAPVEPTAYHVQDLRIPSLLSLPLHQQAAVMEVLNTAVGPCKVCTGAGLSVAACLLQKPACSNMPSIATRAASLAAQGHSAEQITEAIHYDQPWVPVDAGDAPSRGGPGAPVELVMFMEAQCPFCVRASATVDQLQERYGHQLRVIYKHMPLAMHTHARAAALAMEAARRQDRFWEYHDLLYARASELRSEGFFEEIAAQAGLDVARFQRDLDDPSLAANVDADQAQASSLGITGTPNFFVNGYPLRGAQPAEKFAQIIDRELADSVR